MAGIYDDPMNYELTSQDLSRTHYNEFLNDLTDVPSSRALRPFSIDRAGISEQQAYIKVKALFEREKTSTLLITIKMQVSLKNRRGIHMSRCEEALFSMIENVHESLDAFAAELASKLLTDQKAEDAYVDVTGIYIHKRQTVRSKKASYDRMTMFAIATSHKKGRPTISAGLAVYNMTGCPCTETFTKFSVVPKLKEAGYSLKQIKEIQRVTNSGTHTQRGLATLKVDNSDQAISYEDLYTILEHSCHLVYELLKRPDEHELVIRVLNRPQFTEDVVRDIVYNTVEKIGSKLKDNSCVFASSQLYDSIHIHDVYTEINKTYGELANERKTKISS